MKENEAALPAIATCAHRHRARDAILGRPQDLNGDGIVPRRPLLCCCKLGTPRGRRPRHAAHKHHTTLNHTILFNALQTSMHNTFTHLILIFSRPNYFYQLSVFFFYYLLQSICEAVLHTVHLTNSNAYPPRKQNQYEESIFIRKASLPPCREALGCCGARSPEDKFVRKLTR